MAHLHGAVDFGAVEHEQEVVEVADGNLPGDELCVVPQIPGGAQCQGHVDMACPGRHGTSVTPRWMLNTL